MATILIIHGAWSAGWAWKTMRPRLRALGHEVFTPTCTGLGERAHLAHPDVSLDTHIDDMLAVLEYEDLHDVVLVGHSYGGMVATGVADRAAARLQQVVYLDAFVPQDGQSAFDLIPAKARERNLEQSRTEGEGWLLPANPMPPDTSAEDLAWCLPRRRMQPLQAFATPLRLSGAVDTLSAQLHLLHAQRPRRRVPALCRQGPEQPGLALLRARRQPQPAPHDARHAGRAAASHRHRFDANLERPL
jgi:pimeloyl-ACP methyl ester carboxylesterase